MSPRSQAQSTSDWHRHLGAVTILFTLLAIVLAAVVWYLAFGQTIITVYVDDAARSYQFSYSVADLSGKLISATVDDVYTKTDIPSTNLIDGYAIGTVTIVNHTAGKQSLVKTTRLLSESGVLFRTTADITVAGGETKDVPVRADQPGAAGNIGPSHFEIVALHDAVKSKIYGTSSVAMSGGLVGDPNITETVIKTAREAANAALLQKGISALNAKLPTGTTPVTANDVYIDVTNQTTSPVAGSIGSQVVVSSTAKVTTAVFAREAIAELVTADTGAEVQMDSITYTIAGPSADELTINGSATITGAPSSTDFIDHTKLVNRTADQINDYLTGLPGVDHVVIHFAPFWVNTTSLNPNRIVVRLAQ